MVHGLAQVVEQAAHFCDLDICAEFSDRNDMDRLLAEDLAFAKSLFEG